VPAANIQTLVRMIMPLTASSNIQIVVHKIMSQVFFHCATAAGQVYKKETGFKLFII
jgi:hypothetical protein